MNILKGDDQMEMTEGEIKSSYKHAKDKSAQIKILAQLNDCDTTTIKDILEDKKEVKEVKSNKADYSRSEVVEALKKGSTIHDVMENFGITYATASRIKKEAGLTKERTAKKIKTKAVKDKPAKIKDIHEVYPKKSEKTVKSVVTKSETVIPDEIRDILKVYDERIKQLEESLCNLKASRKYLLDAYK